MDIGAADWLRDTYREGFVRFGDLGAAARYAADLAKSEFERIGTAQGWVLRRKPRNAFYNYMEGEPGRRVGRPLVPATPTGDRAGRQGQSPEVAARRKDWEQAARSGDADAMTRTSNALIRAVERDRAASGAPPQPVQSDGRHPTSEILWPQAKPEGEGAGKSQGVMSEAAAIAKGAVNATNAYAHATDASRRRAPRAQKFRQRRKLPYFP